MPAPRKKRAIQRVFSTEEALNEIFHDDDSNDDDFEDMEVSDVEDEQLALPVHGHDDDIGKLIRCISLKVIENGTCIYQVKLSVTVFHDLLICTTLSCHDHDVGRKCLFVFYLAMSGGQCQQENKSALHKS